VALARTRSVALLGVTGHLVEVEADIGSGVPAVVLVGLPDPSVTEARDRIRAALTNSGFEWPMRRITLGLSPAMIPKRGSSFDLAFAVAVLAAVRAIPPDTVADAAFVGELGLDGAVRPVRGVLPAVLAAAAAGCSRVVVPVANAGEARLVPDVDVVAVSSLRATADWLTGALDRSALESAEAALATAPRAATTTDSDPDLAEVRGQPEARYATEVAAAGGHHLLLSGPPGTGKSMLAQRLPGLLPDLLRPDALEVTAIHSVAGTLPPGGTLLERPPYQDPHHTASIPAVLGGGAGAARPGAVSLAHRGVLLLDEAPEFPPALLDGLREPMERGSIVIARSGAIVRFPARFQLVLTANPCPCGLGGGRDQDCRCTPLMRRRYASRLSGPILDRVDIRQTVAAPSPGVLAVDEPETSAVVAARVAAARQRQTARFVGADWRCNAEVPSAALRRRYPPTAPALRLAEDKLRRGVLTARGVDRALRVAWTVADLRGRDRPDLDEVHTALALRGSSSLAA
jgi:magnesium chelatase family protein